MFEHPAATILVVDDDPGNLSILSERLTGWGFRVIVARDGQSAVEKALHGKPDLILLDLVMPKVDGFEACRRLKASESLRTIPVIFMTGLTEVSDKVKGFEIGGVDYITKPFQYDEVRARITTQLTVHFMQKELADRNARLEQEVAHRRRVEEALRQVQAELELRVEARTTELAAANQRLRAEIAEREQSEVERTKLQDRLRQAQKMESIGLLAGGVAHDFNNLLTPILGYTDLLLADGPPVENQPHILSEIRRAGLRARELTHQLLAFSRRQTLELKTVDLGQVVKDFCQVLRRIVREDIQLVVDVPTAVGVVRADAGQLEQVLMNLAVNAQDAMPCGGVLTVSLGNVELDETEARPIPGLVPGPHALLMVSDTGVGMPPNILAHVFEPFFTTKERGKGTGLGLSTSYGIVKQHGGAIVVSSVEGTGSSFRVYLPHTIPSTADTPISDVPVAPPCGGSETILVVEDDPGVREVICNMLQHLGYNVVWASDGESSLAAASRHDGMIDLLLTDVILPKMNGGEVYRLLRDRFPKLRVLYMSGYTNNVIDNQAFMGDVTHIVQKPVSLRALAESLRRALKAK